MATFPTADSLSMFAVGSALRLGKGGLSVVDEVGTVGKVLSVGAQYADTAAIADSTVTLAQNWDRLTPQQQLASIGQLGFWGMSTAVSARQAGGIENLYGAKSIRETFGGKTEGLTPREGLPPTAIETVQPSGKTTQAQEPQVKSPEVIRREQELVQALPKRQQVPVEIDPNLQGNAVRVHYSVDKKGQITDIQIKAGVNATPKDIELHASTVKRMQQYSGMSRHVQQLKDKWKAWRNDHGVPPVGSKAWEAQLELSKLPDIIQNRVERLSNGGLDPKSQQRLEAEIVDLKEQLAEHQKTFKAMDKDPGRGFVAAKDRKEKDFSNINFREIFDSISGKSTQGLSPKEIEESFLLWKEDMAFTAKPSGKEGNFDYGSINPRQKEHHGVFSSVDKEGTLEFTIASTDKYKRSRRGESIGKPEETGADLFARMMIYHRGKVKRIKAHWTDFNENLTDNFNTFKSNQLFLDNEQAAKQTFTGKMAEKFGFTEISKMEVVIDRMGFEHIFVTFEK